MTPHVMQVVYALAAGGSEMVARAIAAGGVARRFRMSVAALHRNGSLEPLLRAGGVATHVVNRADGFQPGVLARMYRLFRRERVDVVLTHHLGQLLYSAPGARLAGCRLIHVEHEYFTLGAPRDRRRLRLAARLAERVVGVSEEVVDFLVRDVGLPRAKVVLIRNGVDTERFAPPRNGERAALGVPSGVPVIGTVGRLDPAKDHGTLIGAFRRVLETSPEARLVIIGDGPRRRELEAAIGAHGLRGRVVLLGERLDVAALLPALDVFVLSSIQEGLSLALLEAMACARPVVVTDVGAAAGVVGDGDAGLVVAPKDAEGLAAAIAFLLSDREGAALLGGRARRLVERRYDLRETVGSYLALCVGGARAGVAA
ncbi:MAG TPA: glycosyltransferase [Methylomirabilota bacterium]|nr:glycosyltransferase [Methylomirabilota bacterium]